MFVCVREREKEREREREREREGEVNKKEKVGGLQAGSDRVRDSEGER